VSELRLVRRVLVAREVQQVGLAVLGQVERAAVVENRR
jgi:hypothetical protein